MKLRKLICLTVTLGLGFTCMAAYAPPACASAVTNINTGMEYAEDFEAFGSQSASASIAALLQNGWYIADRTSLITDTDNGLYGYEFARLMDGGATSNNPSNCIRQCNGGTKGSGDRYYFYGLGKTFPGVAPNAAATGSWEISFDFRPYLVSGAAQFAFSLVEADGAVTGDNAANNILACTGTDFYIGHRSFETIKSGGVAQGIIPALDIGALAGNVTQWFNVKVYVNCDAKYYSVELYSFDGSELIARRSPISFAGDTVSFIKFSAYNKVASSCVWIDNVSIKKASRKAAIYNETFDSFSDGEYRASAGITTGGPAEDTAGGSYFEGYTPWRYNKNVGSAFGLEYDDALKSQVVRLGDLGGGEASGLTYMQYGEDIVTDVTERTRGMAKLSFKIKPETVLSDVTVNVIPSASCDITDDIYSFFKITNGGGSPQLAAASGNIQINADKWYDAELIFDVINRCVKTTVTDMSDPADTLSFTRPVNVTPGAVKGIMFKADGGSSVLLDDAKLEYYAPAPSLDASGVVMTDKFGRAVSDAANVTPALRTIEIPMGTVLDAATINDTTILLKDSSENVVGCSWNIVTPSSKLGDVYRINLNDWNNPLLKGGDTYTVTVPTTVKSIYGEPLQSPVIFTFTTSNGLPDLMKIKAVKVDGVETHELSAIKQNSTINVDFDYANYIGGSANSLAIVEFYRGDMLVNIVLSDTASVSAGEYGTDTSTFAFEVPSTVDMTTVSKVSVFLWDDWRNITPYCQQWDFK